MEFLNERFLGSSVQSWITGAVITATTFFALRYATARLARWLTSLATRTGPYWDDVVAAAVSATKTLLILLLSISLGSTVLELPESWADVLHSVGVVALLFQAAFWLSAGLTTWLVARSTELADEAPADVMTMNVIGIAVRLALWSLVLLLALDNVGVDVTALVAGLGIGGVAVALAAQNILGDLFASVSIALDKPFVIGDFVIVGDFMGHVEYIGLKTTRVRSISGEQVVFSNTDLLESRIRNYGRLYERRVVLKIGVTYQTPRAELEAISELMEDAIVSRGGEKVRFDRAHLASYDDSAISFEAVYTVLDPDFQLHMDIKQDVYLTIHRAFEEREIDFAFPTRTVFLERGE
ncbi:MAG: mechanosensitive ion channel family protein [Longimicrobiales bacterium]|nr:mechanosensitive ion channel family protein [Longimicrobiales bacterium]